jgi:hypothetical protein
MIHKLIVPRRAEPLVRKQLAQHDNHVVRAIKVKAMRRAIDEFAGTYGVSAQ